MGISGTAAYIDLLKELAYNTKMEFQKVCFDILLDLYPSLKQTESLGLYDKAGFDLFTTDEVSEMPSLLFQCKGFQEEFEESQFKQCLKSINSFKKAGIKADGYYLIINKRIKDKKYFEDLTLELENLRLAEQIDHFKILDLDNFLDFLNIEYKRYILEAIKKSSEYFHSQYVSTLGSAFYVENVPFELNKNVMSNPLAYIEKRGSNKAEKGKLEKGKFLFVISEFGFGKTTLLFQLYDKFLLKNKMTPIYIPIGALPPNGLSSEANVVQSIFGLMIKKSSDIDFADKFKRRVFQSILKNNSDLILLFDGMDEHKALKSINGLKIFINSLVDLKTPIIFTMRKEFWDERNEDLQTAIGKNRRVQDKIILTDWDDEQILSCVNKYISQQKVKKNNDKLESIINFKKIIEEKNYSKFYGDIPKRPLFLQMIISDLNSNLNSQEKYSISTLYKKYIIQKITRDRIGSFGDHVIDRGLKTDEGLMEFSHRIFKILEMAASNMFFLEGSKLFAENSIKSSTIRPIIVSQGLHDILDLLLHSVLVTGQERRDFDFNLRFAHFSFIEYFLARFIVNDLSNDVKWFGFEYETSLLQFIGSILLDEEFEASLSKIKKFLPLVKDGPLGIYLEKTLILQPD